MKSGSINNNFRATFLNTIGIKNANNFLENLLHEDYIEAHKLRKAVQKYDIATQHRPEIWKILLGLVPEYKEARDFVHQQRSEHFRYLKSTAHLLKKPVEEKCAFMEKVDSISIDPEDPKQQIVLIYLTQRYYCDAAQPKYFVRFQDLILMTQVFQSVVINDIDAFWCLDLFLKSRAVLSNDEGITRQVKIAQRLLESKDPELGSHLLHHQVSLFQLTSEWFRTSFASLFSQEKIYRVWDKLIGVSPDVAGCLAWVLLNSMKGRMMLSDNGPDLLKMVPTIPENAMDKAMQLFENLVQDPKEPKRKDSFGLQS
eukprot:TRINITY_DN15558_c0_g1_i1.p1 TRINITY_DN15558_c0_g1~~TRINITY_DN15558_c0_g1_i1.p1  ORF type:complete len:313 (-),score=71.23 TRINITY_DN15558_c0_g1_i1:52-990(-)